MSIQPVLVRRHSRTPIEEGRSWSLPVAFIRFIGVAEILGALGLVLPGLVRFGRLLTPLAACGLVIIMIGATVLTASGGPAAAALIPFITGLIAVFIAYGRWRLAA